MIDFLDTQIKGYADSIYEQSLVESAAIARADTTKFLQQRATRQIAEMPFGGTDTQAIIRFYAQHIERCMAARLESYQRAYQEAKQVPSDQDLTDILNDFKAVGELQTKHSSSFIANFLTARSAPLQFDPAQSLMECSAHGHDRVLQTWKIWRDKIRLQRTTPNTGKAPVQAIEATQEKQPKHRTAFSYYWGFCKRFGWECYRTWKREFFISALVAVASYFVSRRIDPAAWRNFAIASLSTAIILGCFALGHLVRTPWLLHREAFGSDVEDRSVHWRHGLLGIFVLVGIIGSGGLWFTGHLGKLAAQVSSSRGESEKVTSQASHADQSQSASSPASVIAPYREPKNSLRKRTVQLASDLEAFVGERWAKRPANQEEARQYDQATINLYVSLYKSRTVGILQELQAKGLDGGLLAAPGAAQSRFLMPDETRQLRDLAYHLDEKGNVVRF